MNTNAKTVFLHPPEEGEAVIPYHYFDSLAEAEQFAWQLQKADPSLEMTLYSGDEYLQMIPPLREKPPTKAPPKRGFWRLF
ncbi:hypothetical protein [Hymenobacter terrestris]|uniref:Uncharacterized protein n=1 Tax=Hymenobacter terrestris TaxID=2748310 RepID=A0ABX2Q364_9BACT|nr:hypothetical protein [Hymenobacter terrestris]NVO85405.1 hypothetical protein [Hymenobacter terrestris]